MGCRQNTYEPTYMDPDNHKFINNAPSQCCDFALLYLPRAIFRSQEILPEILPFLNDLCAMRVVFETGCHFQCPIVSDFLFLRLRVKILIVLQSIAISLRDVTDTSS